VTSQIIYIRIKSIEASVVFSLTDTVESKLAFIVPFAPNPSFLGRLDIMTILDEHFARGGETGPITIKKAALCGLGGIG